MPSPNKPKAQEKAVPEEAPKKVETPKEQPKAEEKPEVKQGPIKHFTPDQTIDY